MGKRLFVFGCSFTAYSWPSWADFLSIGYDEYYNYALAGIGNRAIAERLIEAHATHNICKDDTVIVQWSTHLRNDWYNPNIAEKEGGVSWKTDGSLFNYKNMGRYNQEWYDTFFYEPAYLMHTYNFILMAQNVLENTNCTYFMTSVGDLRNGGSDLKDSGTFNENVIKRNAQTNDFSIWEDFPHLKEIYSKPIWEDRSNIWLEPIMIYYLYNCQEFTYRWRTEEGRMEDELHPSVEQHFLWLEDQLLTKLKKEHIIKECEDICKHTRLVYNNCYNNMLSFERHIGSFNHPKLSWPNQPLGNLK